MFYILDLMAANIESVGKTVKKISFKQKKQAVFNAKVSVLLIMTIAGVTLNAIQIKRLSKKTESKGE